MPRSIAAWGVGASSGEPSIAIVPAALGSRPNRMRASSERPEPIRPGDADHLARLDAERDVLDDPGLAQPAHLEHRWAGRAAGSRGG